MPRRGSQSATYGYAELLRTRGYLESDAMLTLHNIDKRYPQLTARTWKVSSGALWKPGSEAYVCNLLHYEGFQGSTRAKPNKLATEVVQGPQQWSLSAGSEEAAAPSRISPTTYHVLWYFCGRLWKQGSVILGLQPWKRSFQIGGNFADQSNTWDGLAAKPLSPGGSTSWWKWSGYVQLPKGASSLTNAPHSLLFCDLRELTASPSTGRQVIKR